ncbi:fimbrial subunit [Salmonella enterica subsp. enterica serovar Typhimurium]|nr:fimbrial subunit [Salmonella enterica subsp. enterica serovar Typhimurium]
MNMNRFAALAALLTFTGLALWSPSISAAYNTADAVGINVTGLIYADPCTVTVPDTLSLDNMPGRYRRGRWQYRHHSFHHKNDELPGNDHKSRDFI